MTHQVGVHVKLRFEHVGYDQDLQSQRSKGAERTVYMQFMGGLRQCQAYQSNLHHLTEYIDQVSPDWTMTFVGGTYVSKPLTCNTTDCPTVVIPRTEGAARKQPHAAM